MPPDDSDKNKQEPLVEAEGDSGGGDDKPRRPTAVGAGDSDDEDYMKGIGDLRRFDLDAIEQGYIQPEDIESWPIPGLTFVRIEGITRSWELEQENQRRGQQSQQQIDPDQLPKRMFLLEDALTCLSSQKACLAYAVIGSKTGVNYYMGMALQSPPDGMEKNDRNQVCYEIQKSILHSVYEGLDIHKKAYLSNDIREIIAPVASNVGIVTGVALLKNPGEENLESEQIERIANGLQGLDFGMLILAVPIPESMVSEEEVLTLDALRKAQNNQNAENNRRMKYFIELQDAYLKQVRLGGALGHWQVGFYFFASRPDTFVRLRSLIKAAYTDETARPTPLRTLIFKGLKEHLLNFGLLSNTREGAGIHKLFRYKFLSPLNSRMLSAYMFLPKRDMAGFRVRRSAEFSLFAQEPRSGSNTISIGNILDRGVDTGNLYQVDVDFLKRHTIICGISDGGKTNTCFNILDQLWRHAIPFLVIEPSKSEYRYLLLGTERFKTAGQVFTLGDENVSPCCLNPFEIKKNVSVRAHATALIKIFEDSFKISEDMKLLLGEAVIQTYISKGWDLDLNKNCRLADVVNLGDSECLEDIFPTMNDLLQMIKQASETSLERLKKAALPDSRAALEFIISSLLCGDKGEIFNSSRSIPPEIIFGHPTVVELKCITDNSEKMFLAELLLLQLYEYRKYQPLTNELTHIAVIEDTHLLSSASFTNETFVTDVLSEIQAFGQGLIILDPSPRKLEKILPQADLKIMHRIVSLDDRECLGPALNLNEVHKRHMTALGQGRAMVSSNRLELPFHLSIMFDKAVQVPLPDTPEEGDQMVRDAMKRFQSEDARLVSEHTKPLILWGTNFGNSFLYFSATTSPGATIIFAAKATAIGFGLSAYFFQLSFVE